MQIWNRWVASTSSMSHSRTIRRKQAAPTCAQWPHFCQIEAIWVERRVPLRVQEFPTEPTKLRKMFAPCRPGHRLHLSIEQFLTNQSFPPQDNHHTSLRFVLPFMCVGLFKIHFRIQLLECAPVLICRRNWRFTQKLNSKDFSRVALISNVNFYTVCSTRN